MQEIQFFMDKFIKIIYPEGNFPVKKAVIALGVFDGVHSGHQLVVRQAAELAAAKNCAAGAVTFVPHPRQVLTGASGPGLLIPETERIRRLLDAGADFAAQINFDERIAAWDAETFLINLRDCGIFELAGICVGSNWRFGKNGSGTRDVLAGFCAAADIDFIPVPEMEADGAVVSSTRIREAVAAGQLAKAYQLAGYLPQLTGTVGGGMQIAGKVLNAPTANVVLQYGVLPPDGVYAGYSELNGKKFPAVLNIGTAPTYDVSERRIEVHLIGFSGNLYGKELTVSLVKKLRDICKFNDPQELKNQISSDIENASRCVAGSEL